MILLYMFNCFHHYISLIHWFSFLCLLFFNDFASCNKYSARKSIGSSGNTLQLSINASVTVGTTFSSKYPLSGLFNSFSTSKSTISFSKLLSLANLSVITFSFSSALRLSASSRCFSIRSWSSSCCCCFSISLLEMYSVYSLSLCS